MAVFAFLCLCLSLVSVSVSVCFLSSVSPLPLPLSLCSICLCVCQSHSWYDNTPIDTFNSWVVTNSARPVRTDPGQSSRACQQKKFQAGQRTGSSDARSSFSRTHASVARACAPPPCAHVSARATSASDSPVHCGCRCRSCQACQRGLTFSPPTRAHLLSLTPDRRTDSSPAEYLAPSMMSLSVIGADVSLGHSGSPLLRHCYPRLPGWERETLVCIKKTATR